MSVLQPSPFSNFLVSFWKERTSQHFLRVTSHSTKLQYILRLFILLFSSYYSARRLRDPYESVSFYDSFLSDWTTAKTLICSFLILPVFYIISWLIFYPRFCIRVEIRYVANAKSIKNLLSLTWGWKCNFSLQCLPKRKRWNSNKTWSDFPNSFLERFLMFFRRCFSSSTYCPHV